MLEGIQERVARGLKVEGRWNWIAESS